MQRLATLRRLLFIITGNTLLALGLNAQNSATATTVSAAQTAGNATAGMSAEKNAELFLPGDWDGLWQLSHENDWFFGSDRDLTSVLRLAYTLPNYRNWNDVPVIPNCLGDLFDQFNFINDPWSTVTAGFYVQQNMYTPNNIAVSNPNPNDRPYAGWLGVGMDMVRMNFSRKATFETNFGLIGPESGAEALQKSFHSLNGSTYPKGWDHQLKNEPVLQFTYRQDWRPDALTNLSPVVRQTYGFDVIGHTMMTAGNGWDYAGLGAMARFGYHLPLDFGPARPRLGEIDTLPYRPGGSGPSTSEDWSFNSVSIYICTGIEGRAVARDISLDGNTLANSPSVHKEPLVGTYFTGVVIQYGALHGYFMGNYETKTFTAQVIPGQWRGIITVGWGF